MATWERKVAWPEVDPVEVVTGGQVLVDFESEANRFLDRLQVGYVVPEALWLCTWREEGPGAVWQEQGPGQDLQCSLGHVEFDTSIRNQGRGAQAGYTSLEVIVLGITDGT